MNWTDEESGILAIALSVDKKLVSGSSDSVMRSRQERFRSGWFLWVTTISSLGGRRINIVCMCNESSILVAQRIDQSLDGPVTFHLTTLIQRYIPRRDCKINQCYVS